MVYNGRKVIRLEITTEHDCVVDAVSQFRIEQLVEIVFIGHVRKRGEEVREVFENTVPFAQCISDGDANSVVLVVFDGVNK